jgi:hypothetical protein
MQHIKKTVRQILKIILLGLITTNIQSVFSQTDKRDFVFKWENTQDNSWISIDSTLQKFTPTVEEIKLAKETSIDFIDSLELTREPNLVKQYGKILRYRHQSYLRQYLGYIDDRGNKIVLINACCTAAGEKEDMEHNWIFVLDGGSCFFQIKVNLRTKKCFDFFVNGEA